MTFDRWWKKHVAPNILDPVSVRPFACAAWDAAIMIERERILCELAKKNIVDQWVIDAIEGRSDD